MVLQKNKKSRIHEDLQGIITRQLTNKWDELSLQNYMTIKRDY